MPSPKKDNTIEEFLFGDYDEDGVLNIDDPAPFDPDITRYPDIRENPGYYLQSRFGGPGTNFSEVLLKIKAHNDSHAPLLWKFLEENPGSFGRVKTVPSTVHKLYRAPVRTPTGDHIMAIDNFKDIVGASVIMDDREGVHAMGEQIKKAYQIIPGLSKDFYAIDDRKDPYRGVHHVITDRAGRRMEVQIRSKPMDDLAVISHPYYKSGADMSEFIDEVDKLIEQGF